MSKQNPTRQLIVFSDPGGAKPCLSLAKKWIDSKELLVCSDRQFGFYDMFGIPVRRCDAVGVETVYQEFQPEALYTGTSYTGRLEIEFIRAARIRNIPSTSFIDHYTGFHKRFLSDGVLILPDQIHVLDERALSIALEAGLPKDRLKVTGNPYHTFLCRWKSKITKEALWEKLRIRHSNRRTYLFAPDPLSNAGGIQKYGTDEVAILKLLLQALGQWGLPVQLLIKIHPNQSVDYLKSGLKECPSNVDPHWVGAEFDSSLNDLIAHSGLVIGMFSNLLIEAEILGCRTLRILAGINKKELAPILHLEKGVHDLPQLIQQLIENE